MLSASLAFCEGNRLVTAPLAKELAMLSVYDVVVSLTILLNIKIMSYQWFDAMTMMFQVDGKQHEFQIELYQGVEIDNPY